MQILNLGDRLDIIEIPKTTNREKEPNHYASQLLDYNGGRMARVAMPTIQNRIIPLDIGTEYILCFVTKSGLYQCKGVVRDRFKDGNIFVLEMEFLSLLEKHQRRKYFRLECMKEVRARVITTEENVYIKRLESGDFSNVQEKEACQEKLQQLQRQWDTAILLDISGGGARFTSRNFYEKDSTIIIGIPVGTMNNPSLTQYQAEVVSCRPLPSNRSTNEVRVQFDHITENDRDGLIKYIFEEQRKRMRK